MKFLQEAFRNMHPLLQFVFITSMAAVGLSLATTIAFHVSGCLCGTPSGEAEYLAVLMDTTSEKGICSNLVLNDLNQILTFFGAGLVYCLLFGKGIGVGFNQEGKSNSISTLIACGVGLTVLSLPFLDLSYRFNHWLIEGTSLFDIAHKYEETALKVTKAMLDMDTTNELAIILFSVAILPAIAEELLFRGALQPMFAKWSGNIHVGIWVSAILFSAIHFQFFGFIPRVLLGAGFGYLVVASGSIWTAIACHFINNAIAVLEAWFFKEEFLKAGLDPSSEVWGASNYVMAILFGLLFILLLRKTTALSVMKQNEAKYLGLEQ